MLSCCCGALGAWGIAANIFVYSVLTYCFDRTWPAVWEVGDDWPNQGEVDILEGVNDQGPDQATLHTAAGCSMPKDRTMIGCVLSSYPTRHPRSSWLTRAMQEPRLHRL